MPMDFCTHLTQTEVFSYNFSPTCTLNYIFSTKHLVQGKGKGCFVKKIGVRHFTFTVFFDNDFTPTYYLNYRFLVQKNILSKERKGCYIPSLPKICAIHTLVHMFPTILVDRTNKLNKKGRKITTRN